MPVKVEAEPCLFLARTYRQSRRRGTSAMASGSDIPAAMSGFGLIPSGIPPGPDVTEPPGIRGVMTHNGLSALRSASCLPDRPSGGFPIEKCSDEKQNESGPFKLHRYGTVHVADH